MIEKALDENPNIFSIYDMLALFYFRKLSCLASTLKTSLLYF